MICFIGPLGRIMVLMRSGVQQFNCIGRLDQDFPSSTGGPFAAL
jgi:hypothetical protein